MEHSESRKEIFAYKIYFKLFHYLNIKSKDDPLVCEQVANKLRTLIL